MAHAEWWNFIGPYFAKTHRVIAMNLGGMGESDWKKKYSIESWGDEIVGVCKKEKLKKPIIVGHSLGGMCSVIAASSMKKNSLWPCHSRYCHNASFRKSHLKFDLKNKS